MGKSVHFNIKKTWHLTCIVLECTFHSFWVYAAKVKSNQRFKNKWASTDCAETAV